MAKSLTDFPENFDAEQYRKDAEKLGEEVATYVQKGYANRLRVSDIYTRRAFDEGYSALNYQLQFGVIDQETYFEKLAALRDRYFSKSTQEWYKYTAEIYDYKTKMLEEYEKAVAESAERIAQVNRERLKDAQNSLDEMLKQTEKNLTDAQKALEQKKTDADAIRENVAKANFTYVDNAISELTQIVEDAERAAEAIDRAKKSYADKLETSFGERAGYDTKITKIHNYYPTGDTLVLTDYSLSKLDEEIEKIRTFDETLTQLEERAKELDAENVELFFENLRDLPIEDANRLANLLLAGDEETFLGYLTSFGERKELSEQIAKKLYGADYAALAKNMQAEIEGVFAKIPEGFFATGEKAAEQFMAGFAEQVSTMFSNVEWLFDIGNAGKESTYSAQTYSPTYNLYGSGETVSEQLIAARNAASLERMRIGA